MGSSALARAGVRRVVALLAIVGALAAGCGRPVATGRQGVSPRSTTSTSTTTTLPSGPVRVNDGGRLTFGAQQELFGFNINTSAAASQVGAEVDARVYPEVFRLNARLKPVLDTELMDSAELVDTNPQTIIYKIDPKAVWSDGVPINADDFVYNWQAQSGNPALTDVDGKPYDAVSVAGYDQIRSVTGSDGGKTVTVVFDKPYADWESLFGAGRPLIPAHIAKMVGWNTGFDRFDPNVEVSGGPYLVQSDTPGSQVVLVRNPSYWGKAAHLASIVFKLVADPAQDVSLLQNDQVQLVYPQAPQLGVISQVSPIPGVAAGVGQGLDFEQLDFNQQNPVLADPVVRRALAKAVDRSQLVRQSVDQLDPRIRVLNNRIYVNNQVGYQDNSGADYQHADLVAEARLLTGDGFTMDLDGTWNKGGVPLEVRLGTATGDDLALRTEQILAGQLTAGGIKVDMANDPPGKFMGIDLPGGNFDLALFTRTASPFPSASHAAYAAGVAGSQNYDGHADPVVDSLLATASGELNAVTATADYNRVDTLLWKDMVTLPLYQEPTFIAFNHRYGNIAANPSTSTPFWDCDTWGLKAEG